MDIRGHNTVSLAQAWTHHVEKWDACRRCKIGTLAAKHVFGRGTLPCNVLFIGEAPGKAEDVIGEPFVGPSGRLLSKLLVDSGFNARSLTYAVTNIVACRSTDCHGGPNRAPSQEEARNCRPRLEELVVMAAPLAVVLLGRVTAGYAAGLDSVVRCELPHPSYVLRSGGVESDAYGAWVCRFKAFLEEVFDGR